MNYCRTDEQPRLTDADVAGVNFIFAVRWPTVTSYSARPLVPRAPADVTLVQTVVKALYELARTGGKRALVTMCIGGGQGMAAIFERG